MLLTLLIFFGCFEKFLTYTVFLPSIIVVRHQMVKLTWRGAFCPPPPTTVQYRVRPEPVQNRVLKVIHFTLYDFKQCLDSLWSKESMLVLWEAGDNNELFTLIYALNMKPNITVLTPYGATEEFSAKDIVKKGTCDGSILCSTSTGQYCTDKYSKCSGLFIYI